MKAFRRQSSRAGTIVATVKATGKAAKKLEDKGKVEVTVDVEFAPVGGDTAVKSATVALKLK